MAGSASNWYKVAKGPLKGQTVYLSKAQTTGKSRQDVLSGLESGKKALTKVINIQTPLKAAKPGYTFGVAAATPTAPKATAAPAGIPPKQKPGQYGLGGTQPNNLYLSPVKNLKLGNAIQNALHDQASVLTLPKMRLGNVFIHATDTLGAYFATNGSIQIHPATTTPGLAVLHENGHRIDHQAFGPQPHGKLASQVLPEFQAFHAAVRASKGYQALEKAFKKPNGSDKGYLNYMLQPHEAVARAFAQYIATKSGSPALKSELDSLRTPAEKYHIQWADDDFAPIGAALDGIFAARGWKV